ncbi:hypothetical protein [Paracoccus sp. DMF]|uniref:hypothetical protein n=1 Tax=Paracoccus sp. DMF TaxID=400837 RepID=UPI0021E3E6CD|nr:hypothetical protein [Paracoccus sp. DMF]MCV2449513.1 hypothetical protein [Paracoccus sp. DMF]
MLVTFMGLVSASVLPTVSLAIGSMSGTGRSVQKIEELYRDLRESSAALFRTLICVGLVFAALVAFAMTPIWNVEFVLRERTFHVPDAARRLVQVLIFGGSVLAVWQAYRIPKTFLKVLTIKRDIATYEARKEIRANAPGEAEIKQLFPKKEGFGKTVNLEQLGK